jgi:hypothetical protein
MNHHQTAEAFLSFGLRVVLILLVRVAIYQDSPTLAASVLAIRTDTAKLLKVFWLE